MLIVDFVGCGVLRTRDVSYVDKDADGDRYFVLEDFGDPAAPRAEAVTCICEMLAHPI